MQALSARRGLNVQPRLPLPLDLHAISVPARQFTGDFHFSQRSSSQTPAIPRR